MSWDVWLTDDRGHSDGSWNYTHNCNPMIDAVLGDRAEGTPSTWWGGRSWWRLLDGMSGPEGAELLDVIISGLEADPARFEAMNPDNGWGSYVSLLAVLREMRAAVPEWPTTWRARG